MQQICGLFLKLTSTTNIVTQNLQNFCFICKLFHCNWAHINTQQRQRSADLHHSRRCWRCVPAHPVPRSVCGNPYLRTDRKNRCQSGVRIKKGHWKEKQFIQRHCGSNSTNDNVVIVKTTVWICYLLWVIVKHILDSVSMVNVPVYNQNPEEKKHSDTYATFVLWSLFYRSKHHTSFCLFEQCFEKKI